MGLITLTTALLIVVFRKISYVLDTGKTAIVSPGSTIFIGGNDGIPILSANNDLV